jgi:hypothetical protein
MSPVRTLPLVALAALGCVKDKPAGSMARPTSVPAASSARPETAAPLDASAPPVASAQPPAHAGPSWLVFHRGDDVGDMGPEWSFEVASLPAVSSDGASVLVPYTEVTSASAVPNLRLDVVRVSDGAVVHRTPILGVPELVVAMNTGTGADALAELAERVETRVARANAEMPGQGWAALAACTILDKAESAQPPCSMAEQHVECGALRIVDRQGRLDLSLDKRTASVRAPRGAVHAVRSPDVGSVAVRSCLGGVWIDASRRVLVGALLQECQGGGDWCIAPTEWHVVRLPFAVAEVTR